MTPSQLSFTFRPTPAPELAAALLSQLRHVPKKRATAGTLMFLVRRSDPNFSAVSLARVNNVLHSLAAEGRAERIVDQSLDRLTETVRTVVQWKEVA